MIFDLIIGVAVSMMTAMLGLFPAYSLPPAVADAGVGFGSALATANAWFPVTTLGICLLALAGTRVFVFTIGFIAWLWGLIPFKAT